MAGRQLTVNLSVAVAKTKTQGVNHAPSVGQARLGEVTN